MCVSLNRKSLRASALSLTVTDAGTPGLTLNPNPDLTLTLTLLGRLAISMRFFYYSSYRSPRGSRAAVGAPRARPAARRQRRRRLGGRAARARRAGRRTAPAPLHPLAQAPALCHAVDALAAPVAACQLAPLAPLVRW